MAKNKTAIVNWFDDYNVESYIIAANEYKLKVLDTNTIDENTIEITVSGPIDNVNEFLDDFDDGCVRPLDEMSKSCEYDDDYEKLLDATINNLKNNLK